MGSDDRTGSFLQGFMRRLGRGEMRGGENDPWTPLAVLESIHGGNVEDYCLYLRPPIGYALGNAPPSNDPLSPDIEELLIRAFSPLPIVPLEEMDREHAGLPDEAFLTLVSHARVLLLIPWDHPKFFERLKLLKKAGELSRCVWLMPEQGTLGKTDWPERWNAVRSSATALGLELSAYTAGGWLFRVGKEGKACTFRPIVNPNFEKIAAALEAICAEMQ